MKVYFVTENCEFTYDGVIGIYSTIEKAKEATLQKLREWIFSEDYDDINNVDLNEENDDTDEYKDCIKELEENFCSTGFHIYEYINCEERTIDKIY